MVYSTESSRWKAYQFSDPFAADSFYVINEVSRTFCRPDCDVHAISSLKSEIAFVDTPTEALQLGYHDCTSCDPLNVPAIDVNLLIKCVSHINLTIGFYPPVLSEMDYKDTSSSSSNGELTNKQGDSLLGCHNLNERRSLSIPVSSSDNKTTKDFETTTLSKNDSDHYCLVDLACRHLALAAAINFFQIQVPKNNLSPEESPSKKRKRRGGVLGFKELAAKSKLSAWHFHRVFKSVTGLTPKTYGDKCWNFFKKCKESGNISKYNIGSRQSSTPVMKSPSLNKDLSCLEVPDCQKTPINTRSNYQSPRTYPIHYPSNHIEAHSTDSMPPVKKIKIESPTIPFEAAAAPAYHDFVDSVTNNIQNSLPGEITPIAHGNMGDLTREMFVPNNINHELQDMQYGVKVNHSSNFKMETDGEIGLIGLLDSLEFPELNSYDFRIPESTVENPLMDNSCQYDDINSLILI